MTTKMAHMTLFRSLHATLLLTLRIAPLTSRIARSLSCSSGGHFCWSAYCGLFQPLIPFLLHTGQSPLPGDFSIILFVFSMTQNPEILVQHWMKDAGVCPDSGTQTFYQHTLMTSKGIRGEDGYLHSHSVPFVSGCVHTSSGPNHHGV